MVLCAECGRDLGDQFWELKLKRRHLLVFFDQGVWHVCCPTCAEKLMKRIAGRRPQVGYSSGG